MLPRMVMVYHAARPGLASVSPLCPRVLSAVRAGDRRYPNIMVRPAPPSHKASSGISLRSPKEKPADQSQRVLSLVLTLGFQGLAPANNRRPNQPGAPALKKVILACQKIRCSERATAIEIHWLRPLQPAQSFAAGSNLVAEWRRRWADRP
jgi:hypothetical protein